MSMSAKEVKTRQDRHRQFLATAILIAANEGIESMREMVAQAYASYFAMADGMSRHDAINEVITVQARTMGLLDDDGVDIWPELMPGGNQANEMLTDIDEYLREGKMPEPQEFGGVTTAPNHRDHAEQVINHIAHLEDHQIDQIRDALGDWLVAQKKHNIVLNYEMVIADGSMDWHTDQAEFFTDEHGSKWVKFRPSDPTDEFYGGELIVPILPGFHIIRKEA
jgi:hypothetical protein